MRPRLGRLPGGGRPRTSLSVSAAARRPQPHDQKVEPRPRCRSATEALTESRCLDTNGSVESREDHRGPKRNVNLSISTTGTRPFPTPVSQPRTLTLVRTIKPKSKMERDGFEAFSTGTSEAVPFEGSFLVSDSCIKTSVGPQLAVCRMPTQSLSVPRNRVICGSCVPTHRSRFASHEQGQRGLEEAQSCLPLNAPSERRCRAYCPPARFPELRHNLLKHCT